MNEKKTFQEWIKSGELTKNSCGTDKIEEERVGESTCIGVTHTQIEQRPSEIPQELPIWFCEDCDNYVTDKANHNADHTLKFFGKTSPMHLSDDASLMHVSCEEKCVELTPSELEHLKLCVASYKTQNERCPMCKSLLKKLSEVGV